MKILDSVLSLEQMEDILEKELERQKHSIRIFGDLDLSYEDYKCLSLKFRGIYRYPGSIEILENFKLSLLTAWIFSLRYEKEEISYYNIKKVLLKLPQYMQRKFISMCSETFEEYELFTYTIHVSNLKDLCSVIAIHAGIPDRLLDRFYRILYEDIMNYELQEESCIFLEKNQWNGFDSERKIKSFVNRIIDNLSQDMKEIYQYIEELVLEELVQAIRNIFLDCYFYELSIPKLLKKYPVISKKIIESCSVWCREWKRQNKMQVK